MIIAVDPDVFVASLTDGNCGQLVLQIRNNLDELRIVVDDKGKILKEYGDFLLSHFDEQEEHLTIKLLQEILFDKEKVILPLPTSISSSLQTLINKRRCITPLEPELIPASSNFNPRCSAFAATDISSGSSGVVHLRLLISV